jgi:hypothetical protein
VFHFLLKNQYTSGVSGSAIKNVPIRRVPTGKLCERQTDDCSTYAWHPGWQDRRIIAKVSVSIQYQLYEPAQVASLGNSFLYRSHSSR